MASKVAQHFMDKFGMVTVFDAVFYPVSGNAAAEPIIHFDTLKVSNVSAEGSMKEIRGGQGAELLLTYDYGRTATIEITDALASIDSLQYLWGAKELTGANIGEFQGIIKCELNADGQIDLSNKIPSGVNASGLTVDAVYIEGKESLIKGSDLSSATNAVLVAPSSDDKFKKATVYYTGTGAAAAKQITLTGTDFPEIVKLVGTTFVIDQSTGKKIAMQIEVPRFKLDTNFAFTLEAEGEASVFDFTGMALSAGGDVLIMRTLGEQNY